MPSRSPTRRVKALLSAHEAVERMAGRLSRGRPLEAVRIAWAAAAGERLAARSEVLGLDGGRLSVAVADERWAGQLESMSRTLLEHLARTLGRGRVRSLVFEVRTSGTPRPPAPAAAERPPPPPSEDDLKLVREAGVRDPGLARAIAAARAAQRRWREEPDPSTP